MNKDWRLQMADLIEAELNECTDRHQPNCHANEIIKLAESVDREARADEREDMSASKMIRLGIKEALESLRGEIEKIDNKIPRAELEWTWNGENRAITWAKKKVLTLLNTKIQELS